MRSHVGPWFAFWRSRARARSVPLFLAASLAPGCTTTPSARGFDGTTKPASPAHGNGDTSDDGTPPGAAPDGGAPAGDAAALPTGAIAPDLTVTEIAVLQGVKIDVMKDGARVASRNAPVVAGRDALVRVYVAPAAGYKARALTCELTLADGPNRKVLADRRPTTISRARSTSTSPETSSRRRPRSWSPCATRR
jgi:hypothetical protein